MEKIITEINDNLMRIVDSFEESRTKDAMKYSLLAGGKRIRPLIMLQVIASYNIDYHPFLDIACAIEMVHTYSLIHDDLPGMDNDDMRRGQLTCHKKFDEATAILAGDALLNESVNIIIGSDCSNDLKIEFLSTLYQASGINGMILGQTLDIEFENKTATRAQLDLIHRHKTGDLISAAMKMGAIAVAKKDISIWQEIGYQIGLAFQIQDDVLDVVGDSKILGKNIGSDLENNKSTYVTLIGLEKSIYEVDKCFKKANELLGQLKIKQDLILEILGKLKKRVR